MKGMLKEMLHCLECFTSSFILHPSSLLLSGSGLFEAVVFKLKPVFDRSRIRPGFDDADAVGVPVCPGGDGSAVRDMADDLDRAEFTRRNLYPLGPDHLVGLRHVIAADIFSVPAPLATGDQRILQMFSTGLIINFQSGLLIRVRNPVL